MLQYSSEGVPESVAAVDPRLLLLCGVCAIVSVFVTAEFRALLLPALLLGGLLVMTGIGRRYLALLWAMRWFFLFVFLLHLLFSPGRTLFGSFFLSYDGGLQGGLTVLQVGLSAGFSLLLSRLARPDDLAAGLAALLSPLQRFGLRSDRFAEQMLLTLHVAPIVRDEGAAFMARSRSRRAGTERSGMQTMVAELQALLEAMFNRMLDRIDVMARASATGELRLPELKRLKMPSLSVSNLAAVALITALLVNGVAF